MKTRYWILLAILPAIAQADVPPPPAAYQSGQIMGQQMADEFNQAANLKPNGASAFAAGAANQSAAFHLPTSPVPGQKPVSPGFASVGSIPGQNTYPAAGAATQQFHFPQASGRLPAQEPPGGYVPPPLSGTTPQQINNDAENYSGTMGLEPPHMTVAQARAGSVAVTGRTITVHNGVTYGVTVSSVTPNLFITPFHHPILIVGNARYAKRFAHGRDLIFTTSSFPVGVYVTGRNRNDPVASITLIPSKGAAKNYRLVFPGFVRKAAPAIAANGYASRMVALMRDAVLGDVPEDYRQSRRIPDLNGVGGLSWVKGHAWIGNQYEVLSYRITNTLSQPITIADNAFYHKGILSVALYPHHRLYPDESTNLYLIENLPESHHGLGGVWQP